MRQADSQNYFVQSCRKYALTQKSIATILIDMGKTLLEQVRAKLRDKRGAELLSIAALLGLSYDTLLRIRDGKTDPAFGKVQALAEHLKVVR